VFTRLFKFGFVRNPYDHLVSGYGFMQQYGHPHSHKIVDKSFSEYIDFRLSQTFGHDQSYFLTDRKGRLLVDRVCRFENLEKDVDYLLDCLGLVGQIPHRLRTQRRHYSEYFSAADIVKANPIVARDLDNFGYTFEG